jgi:hypothetical protein
MGRLQNRSQRSEVRGRRSALLYFVNELTVAHAGIDDPRFWSVFWNLIFLPTSGVAISEWIAIEDGNVPQGINRLRAMADAIAINFDKIAKLVLVCRADRHRRFSVPRRRGHHWRDR